MQISEANFCHFRTGKPFLLLGVSFVSIFSNRDPIMHCGMTSSCWESWISLEIMTFGQDRDRDFCMPVVPGLIALIIFPLITQRLLHQILRYFIYE